MKALYDLQAPAKLNAFLHVVGRRSDGYHLLQSVFMLIDWCDTLHLQVRTDGQISRSEEGCEPLPADDLCVRAARALQQATGCRLGVHIHLIKRHDGFRHQPVQLVDHPQDARTRTLPPRHRSPPLPSWPQGWKMGPWRELAPPSRLRSERVERWWIFSWWWGWEILAPVTHSHATTWDFQPWSAWRRPRANPFANRASCTGNWLRWAWEKSACGC
jgi:hypothetical protein